jgi:hypothetical protein
MFERAPNPLRVASRRRLAAAGSRASAAWLAAFVAFVASGCAGGDEDLSVPLPPGAVDAPPPLSKVVVLQAEGLDPARLERGIRDGYLPNLRRLRIEGTMLSLRGAPNIDVLAGAPVPAARDVMAPVVAWRAGRELVERHDYESVPDALPILEASAPGGAPLRTYAGVLGAPTAALAEPDDALAVLPGALPPASFDAGTFVFVREVPRDAKAGERRVPGGIVIEKPADTSGEFESIFVIELPGPPARQGDSEPAMTARIEIVASRDRMRAQVRSGDDRLEVIAGTPSRPLRVRYEPSRDVTLYARTTVYLRPTGAERLECYLEPIEFDPILQPEWMATSKPREFAAALEREYGYLPRSFSPFPRAALAASLLDARDAVAFLAADFAAERAVLGGLLAASEFRLLHQSVRFVKDAEWFATQTFDADERFELAGRRVLATRTIDAAAGAFDVLVGDVLARIDKRDDRESITLLVCGGGPGGGILGMSRLAYDAEPLRDPADVAATVFALLEQPLPPRIAGSPLPLGAPLERRPEARFEHRPAEYEDEPAPDGE